MAKTTLIELREADHVPTYTRHQRGRSVTFNRPLVGYRIRCKCGWGMRVNGGIREAESWHTQHLRDVQREGSVATQEQTGS
jgi:hypothetical protein